MRPIPLAGGGDAAIDEIWRVGAGDALRSGLRYGALFRETGCETVLRMLATGTNSPLSSGMGRLFDGVCAILGIRRRASYEGQGAVLLEAAADALETGEYPFSFYDAQGVLTLDWPRYAARARIRRGRGRRARGALHEHAHIRRGGAAAARSKETGLGRVVLSGGVFQNMYIMNRLPERLAAHGPGGIYAQPGELQRRGALPRPADDFGG